MATPAYRRGIEQLLGLPDAGNRALICKERNESGCHRRFIARTLRELGQEVVSL